MYNLDPLETMPIMPVRYTYDTFRYNPVLMKKDVIYPIKVLGMAYGVLIDGENLYLYRFEPFWYEKIKLGLKRLFGIAK